LTSISWADASNKVLRSRSYTYTAAGLISDVTIETGEKAIYSYDSLDRLTREKHTDYYGQVISDEKYEYDLSGNRTKKTILDGSGAALLNVNYSLATGNKLGSWTVAETNLATRFSVVGSSADPIGVGIRYGTLWVSNSPSAYVTPYVANTTNFYAFDMTCGMGTQYIFAAIRDLAGNTSYVTNRFYPTCLTNGSYQFNAAGCLTNRQYSGKDYTERLGLIWNGQYQLTAAYTNGALAESFGYDGAGRRIFIVEGGATNWMVYNGNQMVAEVDGSGNLKKSYVYEGLDRAVSITTFGATTNTYYFIRDHLGSTLALTDGSGNIVESYRYDAWGRVLGVYNAAGNQIDESAVGNRILWQGREFSFKTGLYHFRARWYDPGAGRWISNDPLGIAGGLNQTCFCANNPVNFHDPFGLWTIAYGFAASGNAGVAHGAISIQGTASFNGWNPLDWRSGWTFSIGSGPGAGMGFSVGVIGSISGAENSESWNGVSSTGGGTFGDGGTVGYDTSNINTQEGGCPRDKVKNLKHDLTLNFGGYVPWPAPIEFHYDPFVWTTGHSASIRDLF